MYSIEKEKNKYFVIKAHFTGNQHHGSNNNNITKL
jgi:hypothetical protein